MSNEHPGTATKSRHTSQSFTRSNPPKPPEARKSPTVLRLEAEVARLQRRVAELEAAAAA